MQMDFLALAAAAAGVASHLFIFKKNEEPDQHPFLILGFIVFLQTSLWIIAPVGGGFFAAWGSAFCLTTVFVVALCTSILVYRLFCHPLKDYPGPFAARASKLWAISKVVKSNIRWYAVQEDLKKKYGDYVRAGPRELLCFDPEAIPILNALSSNWTKGPWYGSMMEPSLQTFRDKKQHSQRRKIWDRAFTTKSLQAYRPTVESVTDDLMAQLSKRLDKEMTISDWLNFYSYDVMSGMVFGEPMGMLKKGDEAPKWVIDTIAGTFGVIGLLSPMPWIFGTFFAFPALLKPAQELSRWAQVELERRRKMVDPKTDLFTFLLEIDDGSKQSNDYLMADARLAIGAGSDTTSSAATVIMYYLAKYPEQMKKLQAAVDEAFAATEEDKCYNTTRGTNCPHLEGVINEALRLHPGVPGGVQRLAPAGGATINGHYIPEDTVVVMPTFSICRDERNFERGNEFVPERWYSQPELIKNKAAFLPFNSGPYGCVGKGLAMMELRSITARIAKEFDIEFVPGFDVDGWTENIKDHFTNGLPELKVILTKRAF